MGGAPEIRYARSGDVDVAYQVVGSGPRTLIWVPGFISNIETQWELDGFVRLVNQLASFARVILFDKRGTGLSGRVPIARLPTLEERIDDVRSVMDAAGAPSAVLFGMSEGGPMSVLFAATHPERVEGLVLYGSYVRRPSPPEGWDEHLEWVAEHWGTGQVLASRAPGAVAGDELHARLERQSASPGEAAALLRMAAEIDVVGVLPVVSVPTLVLHRAGDPVLPTGGARALAAGIPQARYVELQGGDHIPWAGDSDAVAAEIEEFMTGERPAPTFDRVLLTVLFTDIVDSTRRAAEVGDRRWRDVLDRHDVLAHRAVDRFRGTVVKTTGDGLLATFAGPARGIRCAADIQAGCGDLALDVRAGLHTGEVEIRGADIGGIAVHVAQRVATTAGAGEILVSSTVKDLVAGSGLVFSDRGAHRLKGLPDDWRLFAVTGGA